MPIIVLPQSWAPDDIIPSAWGNNVGRDVEIIDIRTGGDPPAVPNRLLASSGVLGDADWRALVQTDFGAAIVPSSAMVDQKVNQINPQYPTFAGAYGGASGFFDVGPAADAPPGLAAAGFHCLQIRHWNYQAYDYRFQLAMAHQNVNDLYVRLIRAGSAEPWFKLYHAGNMGDGSGANADKVDGFDAGNGTNQVPINNGVLNPNLNAGQFGGLTPAQFAAQVVPAGIVALWKSAATPPTGWTIDSDFANRMPLGVGTGIAGVTNNAPGNAGGDPQHRHTFTHNHGNVTSGQSTTPGGPVSSGGVSTADPAGHVHVTNVLSLTADSGFTVVMPYWRAVYFIIKG